MSTLGSGIWMWSDSVDGREMGLMQNKTEHTCTSQHISDLVKAKVFHEEDRKWGLTLSTSVCRLQLRTGCDSLPKCDKLA